MKKVSILLGGMALFASNSHAALQDLAGWGEGSASCSLSSRQVPQHQGYYGDLLQYRQGPGERDRGERLTEEHAVIQSLIPLLNAVSALFQVLSDKIVVQAVGGQTSLPASSSSTTDVGAITGKSGLFPKAQANKPFMPPVNLYAPADLVARNLLPLPGKEETFSANFQKLSGKMVGQDGYLYFANNGQWVQSTWHLSQIGLQFI